MAWFRNKNGDRVPVREYWRATEAVSRPLAILLTLVVLFVCAALVFSLFLGGRWLYRRTIEHQGRKPITTVQVEGTTSTPNTDSEKLGDIEVGATPTPTPTPTPTATPTPTPVANNAGNIPNTGPDPE